MFSISRSNRQNNPQLPPHPRFASFADLIILLIVGAGTILGFPAMTALKPENVSIYRDNHLIATYPLDTDRTISVKGIRGPVELTIKNGSVAVTEADCPHGICRKTGSIRNPRSQIVCAPNHILITITSSGDDTLDAIVR